VPALGTLAGAPPRGVSGSLAFSAGLQPQGLKMPGGWEAGPGWRAGREGERESLARIGYARTLTRDRSTEAHTPGRCGCRTASCQPSVNVLDGGSGSPGPWPFRAGPSGAVRAPGARARLAGGLVARGRLGAGAGCRAPQGVGALAPGLRLGQQGRGHPAARLARSRAPGRQPGALFGQDGQPVAPQVVRGDPVRLGW